MIRHQNCLDVGHWLGTCSFWAFKDDHNFQPFPDLPFPLPTQNDFIATNNEHICPTLTPFYATVILKDSALQTELLVHINLGVSCVMMI